MAWRAALSALFTLVLLALEGLPISGQVLARGSRDLVVGASVTVDGAPATETDGEGRFFLTLAPGHHTLQVQQPGFEVLTTAVEAAGDSPPLVLRLEPTQRGMRYETVVQAEAVTAPRISLEKEEITRTPGSFGDPFRVIESLPGVSPIAWPLAIYAVRGGNPGNTGYFIDGLRVPALFHFALGPAVIHPHFLEGLDFYAGGYPARHGRYVAGIVSATTAAPPADRPRGSVDLRLFDAGGIVTTPIDQGRGTLAIAGRYGYPAALLSLLAPEVSFAYWDYQARIDHALGPGRLSLFAFGSYDFLRVTDPDEVPDQRGDQSGVALSFHRLDLRWRGAVGRGRVVAGLAAGLDQTTSPFDTTTLSVRGKSLIPRLSYQRPLGAAVDWELGADGELADYDTDVALDSAELAGFARPRQVVQAGLFTSATLRLGSRLALTPGLRLDSYSESSVHATDLGPRLEARVRVADQVWIKSSGGRFTQMPSLPLQIPGFEGFGLRQHGLQTSWQAALGVETTLPADLTLDANTFVQRYLLTDLRDTSFGDPVLADFLTRRDGLAYGLELMVRRPPRARFHGWVSYTLSRSLRSYEGGIVSDADWDQRHVLNVVAGYRTRRYTFGGRFHLHTGRPVQVSNSIPTEFGRLPPFYQLDVRIERRFVLDAFTIDLYLEAVNATLTRQVVELNRRRNGIEGDGFRIVLPSLGVRAEY